MIQSEFVNYVIFTIFVRSFREYCGFFESFYLSESQLATASNLLTYLRKVSNFRILKNLVIISLPARLFLVALVFEYTLPYLRQQLPIQMNLKF